MEDWQLVVATIVGSGGVVAAICKLYDLKRAKDNDELAREETEIERWRAHLRREEERGDRAWRLVAWYRHYYTLARDRLDSDKRADLPAGPPGDVEV